jgi:hypothetical protein
MEIKTLEDLQAADERTLHFTPLGLGKMRPEESADFQQRVMARLQLADDVCGTTRQKFEQLRAAFNHGVLCYELFTLVEDASRLALEQALRDRFAARYEGQELEVLDGNGSMHRITMTKYPAFYDEIRKIRGAKIRMGASRDWERFNGTLEGLQTWARRESLLPGQRNRSMDRVQRALRNMIAHGTYHLTTPVDAARTLSDLAETINHLWGQPTPGGRLYPAPVDRTIVVLGWTENGDSIWAARGEDLLDTDQGDGRTWVVLRAVYDDPNLMEFDARHATTAYPAQYLWGPGTRGAAAAWLKVNQPEPDQSNYLDQVVLVRAQDGVVDLPVYPSVAAGLPAAQQGGTWYAVRVDRALDALGHVRALVTGQGHPQVGECQYCPAETLATGDITSALAAASSAGAETTPRGVPDVRTPLADRFTRPAP